MSYRESAPGRATFNLTGGEITGEFLMSTGYLPGADGRVGRNRAMISGQDGRRLGMSDQSNAERRG